MLKKITEAKIKEAKYRYFKKMTEKSKATNDIALYYRAVGMLKTRGATQMGRPGTIPWKI